LRAGFVVLSLAAVLGLAACGGNEKEAQSLALEQRFIQAEDTPGYEPDPVEGGRHTWDNAKDFVDDTGDQLIDATEAEAEKFLAETGFVRAIGGTRFLPGSDGQHSPGDPHVVMGVLQFESDEGARDAVDWYDEDGHQPCPENCGIAISDFEVDGIPDAKGVRRTLTAERIPPGEDEARPFDSYDIWFANGPFAYYVGTFAPPGPETTEATAEAIAKHVYDRVADAPPPEQ
jgi:hypothetical protein